MSRFLSPAWLAEAADAVAAGGSDAVDADVSLTVQQVVQGGPDGDVAYCVGFGAGRIRFTPGRQTDADIEVSSHYDTAVSISKGELSPAVALASGQLRVRGKVGLLAEHREAWAALEDLLAPVRSTTHY